MMTSLKRLPLYVKFAGLLVVFAAVVYYAGSFIAGKRLENVSTVLRNQIAEQQAQLTAIAEITARNGADSITESVVRDCVTSERTEFDTLLGNLNRGLSTTELQKLERLFGRCGGFYAERKAIMASRMMREIEVYQNYVAQLEAVTDESLADEYRIETWRQLAGEEKKQGELFAEMVTLQEKIITTLLEGKSAQSEEIKTILAEVSETQGNLIVASKQAGAIRQSLISL